MTAVSQDGAQKFKFCLKTTSNELKSRKTENPVIVKDALADGKQTKAVMTLL